MHTRPSLIDPDGTRFTPLVDAPAAGSGPGVFVVGSADVRAACARYAAEGYTAVGLEVASLTQLYVAKSALASEVEGIAWGIVGFGAAAPLAWRAARHGAVAAASIYGIETIGDELHGARAIPIPVAVHIDGEEARRCAEAVEALRADAAGTRLRVYEYPRGTPGCFDPERSGFDPHVERLAHSRTLGVLRPVLGPHYDLARLFQEHLAYEFVERDAHATMATMVDEPYVNHVPTLTGGYGHAMLKRFYRYHFIPKLPRDRESIVLSETVGADTVVLELVTRFTHTEEVDYLLPGIAPTGRVLEIPTVVIAKFRGDKLYHEHIYWDQASLLVQLGLLDPTGLPVAGAEEAHKMLDQRRPANALMARWRDSDGLPLGSATGRA